MADGQFAELQKSHVLAMLDTMNGKNELCKELNLERNASYVLVLNVDQRSLITTKDGSPMHPLDEKLRFVNPKKLDTVLRMVKLADTDSKPTDK